MNTRYGGTKEEMARLIKDASKMTDIQKELNVSVKDGDMSFGNIVNAISVMQKKLDIAGTTAKEASTTISGSMGSAKSAFENFLAGTGGVNEVIQTFTTAGTNIMNAIIKMAPQVIEGLIQMTNALIPHIPPLINALLPTIINGATSLLNGLIIALPKILKMLVGVLPQLTKTLLGMLPTILQVLIQMAIMTVQSLAQMLPTLIPQIVDAILQMIPILMENLPLFIKAGFQLTVGLIEGIFKALPKLLGSLPKIGSAMINYWGKIPSMWKNIGGMLVRGLWNGISDYAGWVISKIRGLGNSILKAAKGIFGVHSPSTKFFWIGKMNMVGLKNGMEDMQPEVQKLIDGMFNLSPNLYNNIVTNLSPVVSVFNNVNVEQDPLGQMVHQIKTFSGGAKNDFNYGVGIS